MKDTMKDRSPIQANSPTMSRGELMLDDTAVAGRQEAAASGPHRREVLLRLLAAALATTTGWHDDASAAALPLERDRFVELSEKLCAMSIDDRSLSDDIQNALVDQYAAEDFRRIAETLHSATSQDIDRLVASLGLHELAKSIVSVWYSGLLGTGEGARVLAYAEALAWRATGYAKAPGTCGEYGDWITKPPNALDRERRP
jgi:Membrane bound FAD containing D-sorbitol dehydrogenase